MNKYNEIIKQNSDSFSHNVYSKKLEKFKDNQTKFCNYLINCGAGENEELILCTCLESIQIIAKLKKQTCKVFKRTNSFNKKWRYLCDISVGVL